MCVPSAQISESCCYESAGGGTGDGHVRRIDEAPGERMFSGPSARRSCPVRSVLRWCGNGYPAVSGWGPGAGLLRLRSIRRGETCRCVCESGPSSASGSLTGERTHPWRRSTRRKAVRRRIDRLRGDLVWRARRISPGQRGLSEALVLTPRGPPVEALGASKVRSGRSAAPRPYPGLDDGGWAARSALTSSAVLVLP